MDTKHSVSDASRLWLKYHRQTPTPVNAQPPRTTVISLPAALRNAFVQRTLRGLRFILKFLWHLLLQKTGRETGNKWLLGQDSGTHQTRLPFPSKAALGRSTRTELLGIVAHKHDTAPGVDGRGAEEAVADLHDRPASSGYRGLPRLFQKDV